METSNYDLFVNNINNQNILKLLDIVKNIGDTDINRCFELDTSKYSDLKNNAGKISTTLLSWSVLDVERLPITFYLLEKDVVDINKTNPLWLSIYSDNLFVARLLLNKNSINVNNSRFYKGTKTYISEMALDKIIHMVSCPNFLESTNILDLIDVCYIISLNKNLNSNRKLLWSKFQYITANEIEKNNNTLADNYEKNNMSSGFRFNPLNSRTKIDPFSNRFRNNTSGGFNFNPPNNQTNNNPFSSRSRNNTSGGFNFNPPNNQTNNNPFSSGFGNNTSNNNRTNNNLFSSGFGSNTSNNNQTNNNPFSSGFRSNTSNNNQTNNNPFDSEFGNNTSNNNQTNNNPFDSEFGNNTSNNNQTNNNPFDSEFGRNILNKIMNNYV